MPTYKVFLTRRSGGKELDTLHGGEPPHVGQPIRVGEVDAVVTSVNAAQFVDQVRGPLDGVVYAVEGATRDLPPGLEVADPALATAKTAGVEVTNAEPPH